MQRPSIPPSLANKHAASAQERSYQVNTSYKEKRDRPYYFESTSEQHVKRVIATNGYIGAYRL